MLVSRIVHVSGFLPNKTLSNEEISKIVDTNDEWITTRTGIKSRHIAADEETTSSMAIESVKILIKETNLDPTSVDALIVATTTPDLSFPSVACMVQGAIGATNAFAFDLSAACSGFVYALSVANSIIQSGNAKKIIVIGSDKMSSLVDWSDRSTCILFGDGAGAALVVAEEIKNSSSPSPHDNHIAKGIIATKLLSSGIDTDLEMLCTSGGVGTTKTSGTITMKGQEVFKNAITKMSSVTRSILEENNLSIDSLDLVIPHQANTRILSATATNLRIPEEKLVVSVDHHGNTSAASIPLAMSLALQQGKIVSDRIILLQCIGAGLTWGACLIKW